MKLALKSMVSTMLAAAVLTASSVTAFAVDYQEDPEYYDPKDAVIADGKTDAGTASKPAEVITEGCIEAAEGETVEVYITEDKGIVTAEGVAAIKKSGKTVTLVADGYTVTLSAADIVATEAASINLAMKITEDTANKEVKIEPVTNGDFGMAVTVTLPVDTVKGIEKPVLTYVADDGTKTDYTSSMTVTDKDVQVKISHASYYVIEEGNKVPGDSESSIPEDSKPDDNKGDDNSGDNSSKGENDVPTGVTLVVVPAAIAGAALVASAIVIKRKNK